MSREVAPRQLYAALLAQYGPQGWWPADNTFEVMVGAVLVQNTAWSNAAAALAQLRSAHCLTPARLAAIGTNQLEALVHPSGTFRVKAKRLQNLARALETLGGVERLEGMTTAEARRFLLGVNGVGAETADAILVYGLARPAFVIDGYARRLVARLVGHPVADGALRASVESAFTEPEALGELHALIVAHGKQHCRTQPRCHDCMLQQQCATGEPVPAGSQCSAR